MVASARAPASLPDGGRFVTLDSWRGIAALGVAVHHLNGSGPLLTGPLHDNLGAAVDFFFVLSGFVIVAAYGERLAAGFSTLRFMVLRAGRVWPLHAAMVALYLVLELAYAVAGGGALGGRAPFTGARDPVALVPVILLLQEYVYPQRDLWNVQSWSISVELGLYFGAALLWRFAGRRAVIVAAVAALLALVLIDGGWAGVWGNLLRGVAGFGLGAGVWTLFRRLPNAGIRAMAGFEIATAIAAVAAIAAAAPTALSDSVFAALVLVFAREQGPLSRALRSPPFVWLGALSYSLYMVHGMVIGRILDLAAVVQSRVGARWVDDRIGGVAELTLAPLPATCAALAMLAAALVAAWLAWRLIEWPARQWSRRRAAWLGVGAEEAQAPTI